MSTITSTEVTSFLLSVKYVVQDKNCVIVGRPKNIATVSSLGIDKTDVFDEIMGLSVEDYYRGPSKDSEFGGDVWEFGKQIMGKEVYIKIKLGGDQRGQWVTVISFHFAKSPLTYPLRES